MARAPLPQPKKTGEGTQEYIRRLAGAGFEVSEFEGSIPDIGRIGPVAISGDYPLRPDITPQQLAALQPAPPQTMRDPVTGQVFPYPVAPQTISGKILTPSVSPTFQTSPIPSIPTQPEIPITTPTLPPEQKNAQDLSTRIQEINRGLVGQAEFKAQQQEAQGLPGLEQSRRDLTAQITSLKNEANAIQFQQAGANVTAGMLGAKQREQLTQNAIKSWGVAAQLDAANGNIQAALDKIDRLIEAKYGRLKEERDVLLSNLEIIQKSPLYTAEEKARADAMAARKKAEENVEEVSRNITKEIGKFLIDPEFQLQAPPEVKRQLNELALKKNLTQADLNLAAGIAAKYMVKPEKPLASEVTRERETAEITNIQNKLLQSRKGGEFADGNVYLEERRKSTLSPTEFDKRFGDLLNAEDRQKYGIAKATTGTISNEALDFSNL